MTPFLRRVFELRLREQEEALLRTSPKEFVKHCACGKRLRDHGTPRKACFDCDPRRPREARP